MSGQTSKVGIISSALVLIGDQPISSLDDVGAGAIVATTLYESSLNNLFSVHRWRFAVKKAVLNRLSETPLNEYAYKFSLPSDLIYVVKASTRNYEIYENFIYCNDKELSIDYGFRPDESKFPAWFVTTCEFYLASLFAVPITGNTAKAQLYAGLYDQQFKKARHADSAERPNTPIQHRPFTLTTPKVRN